MLGCCSLQPTEIAARIDECALARGRAPQQCAVLLQWRYGDDSGFERRCGHERTNGEPGRLVQVLCLYPTRLPVQITRPITLPSAGSMSSQTGSLGLSLRIENLRFISPSATRFTISVSSMRDRKSTRLNSSH